VPWINGVLMPEALPRRIRRLLEDSEIKGLCSVTLLETALLYRLGRLELQGNLNEFFNVGLASDLRLLEISAGIAVKTNELPREFPGDPFDRVIAATASVMKLTLVTADPAIRDSKACDVEYYPFKPRRNAPRRLR